MWAVYRQTFKKYLKAPSTWIIFVLACFISGFLSAGLPWLNFDETKTGATSRYIARTVTVIASTSSYTAIFASIFAGFKSASMFRDEIDQGVFLTILSKPIRRSSILMGKWIALQTLLVLFAIGTTLSFVIVTAILDKGHLIKDIDLYGAHTLRSQLPIVALYLFVIIYIMCLIFSSLSLLISTKLSFGGTIGASIALGIIVPITALIWTFTHKASEYKLSNRSAINAIYDAQGQFKEDDVPQEFRHLSDNTQEAQRNYFTEALNVNSIYALGLSSGMSDSFESAWVGDLQYQISTMGSFASEHVAPDTSRLMASSSLSSFDSASIDQTADHNHFLTKEGFKKDSNNHTKAFNYFLSGLKKSLSHYDLAAQEIISKYWEASDASFKNPKVNSTIHQDIKDTEFIINNKSTLELLKKEFAEVKKSHDQDVAAEPGVADNQRTWAHSWATVNTPYEKDEYLKNITKADNAEPWWLPWLKVYDDIIASTSGYKAKLEHIWEGMASVFNMEKYHRKMATVAGVRDTSHVGHTAARAAFRAAISFDPKPFLRKLYTLRRTDDFMTNFDTWYSRMHKLILPLDKILFNNSQIDTVMEQIYNTKYKDGAYDAKQLFPERNFADHEWSCVERLLTLADDHPELFKKMSTKGYADKNTILWVYLAIALGLLPFVFITIRFQDFR